MVQWNTISPRVGLAFQLTSDKKTLLKASYGRYYDALLMSNWNWPGPNVTDYTIYSWDWDLNAWALFDTIPGAMNYTVDPKLKNPYADQFSVGLEREVLANFAVGATYIYKHEKNLIGWEDRGAHYEQVNMVSPDDGKTYPVWNQTSGSETNDYWITQPSRFGEKFDQTYQAVIFSLTQEVFRQLAVERLPHLVADEGPEQHRPFDVSTSDDMVHGVLRTRSQRPDQCQGLFEP